MVDKSLSFSKIDDAPVDLDAIAEHNATLWSEDAPPAAEDITDSATVAGEGTAGPPLEEEEDKSDGEGDEDDGSVQSENPGLDGIQSIIETQADFTMDDMG